MLAEGGYTRGCGEGQLMGEQGSWLRAHRDPSGMGRLSDFSERPVRED